MNDLFVGGRRERVMVGDFLSIVFIYVSIYLLCARLASLCV